MYQFPKNFAGLSVFLFLVLIGLVSVQYPNQMLPATWMLFGLATVAFFFWFTVTFSGKWQQTPEKKLVKKIFAWAFILRAIYVVFSYIFYTVMTGQPFEFEAADSYGYHMQGTFIAESLTNGHWDIYNRHLFFEKASTMGYIVIVGVIYSFFLDSIILARLFNALLGAWVCVLVYHLAKRSFGDRTARLAAVMAVCAPPLIYYCGLHLKEAVILFLVVYYINLADIVLRAHRVQPRDLLLMAVVVIVMFFFRNALAVAMLLSFMLALVFTKVQFNTVIRRFGVGFLILGALTLFFLADFSGEVQEETERYLSLRGTHIQQHMQHFATRAGGNPLAILGTATVFAPLAVIGPLPTLADTGQANIMMLAGSMFTRNVYVFFALFGMLLIVRRKLIRENLMMLTTIASWIFIIANSGFALSDRFHLIFVPFLIILASFGITQSNKRTTFYFLIYMAFLSALIIAWNWFKMAGRGFA